jgi:hypothetical protein
MNDELRKGLKGTGTTLAFAWRVTGENHENSYLDS